MIINDERYTDLMIDSIRDHDYEGYILCVMNGARVNVVDEQQDTAAITKLRMDLIETICIWHGIPIADKDIIGLAENRSIGAKDIEAVCLMKGMSVYVNSTHFLGSVLKSV